MSKEKFEKILSWVRQNPEKINHTDTNKRTLLHRACLDPLIINNDLILFLLEKGADPNATDINGITPLISLLEKNLFINRSVHALLIYGADPRQIPPNKIPLELKMFLQSISEKNNERENYSEKYNQEGINLINFIFNDNFSGVKEILNDNQKIILYCDDKFQSIFHHACFKDVGINIFDAVLDNQPDLTTVDANGNTPLHTLILNFQNQEKINNLLNHLSLYQTYNDIFLKENLDQRTPLQECLNLIKEGKIGCEIFSILTPHYSKEYISKFLNELFKSQFWAQQISGEYINHTQEEVLKILLHNKADINYQNEDGKTILHESSEIEGETHQEIEMLIKYGADWNIKDKNGNTPITISSEENRYFIECYAQKITLQQSIEPIGDDKDQKKKRI